MNIANQSPLTDSLKSDAWVSVDIMPVQDRPNLYLDMVLTSSLQSIRFAGKELAIDADNETFVLAFYEHKREGYWAQDSDWTSKRLDDICGKDIVESLFEPPRDIRLFTSPLLQQIDAGAKT